MFDLDSLETKKYGLCWNMGNATEYPDSEAEERSKRCKEIVEDPTASLIISGWLLSCAPEDPSQKTLNE